MEQVIHSHRYANGLVLVAEPIASLESVAFTFLVPAGCRYEPLGREGLAGFACDMALRGAGERDSRKFLQDLENLGVERSESVSNSHTGYSGATLAANLGPALGLYADLLQRPQMPAEMLEASRMLMLQELQAIEDEPSQKVMLQLRRLIYPEPLGRGSQGRYDDLLAITMDDIRQFHARHNRPNGTILGVAGRFDWEQLRDVVGACFGQWQAQPEPQLSEGQRGLRQEHLEFDSSQTHVGIAYESIPYRHDRYFQASGAIGVLSGGMSSRLFTEVREKRGLCYAVFASLHTLHDRGSVLCYAGTTADRAQETLDVTLHELKRLGEGVAQQELDRLKARIKSSLIMQQESSSSRSSSLARDWYHLGRARTLDEVGERVDALSCRSINDYLAEHPAEDFTIVTLGPKPLEVHA